MLVLGERPALESKSPAAIRAFLDTAAHSTELTVLALLDAPQPRIAYAFTSQRSPTRYIAYTETNLPKDRRSPTIQRNTAFADLDYAVYLGSSERAENLLTSSDADLPLRGRRSAITVPFGNNKLRIVMSPAGELGGTLLARLQWLLLGFGVLLTLRRRRADRAPGAPPRAGRSSSRRRTPACTRRSGRSRRRCSTACCRRPFPRYPELTVGARYIAGVADIEIGGDWYDVMPLDGGNVLFVVGDVSGRGLPAGTIMAALRYAIRAYAAQGDDPATILTKLAGPHRHRRRRSLRHRAVRHDRRRRPHRDPRERRAP